MGKIFGISDLPVSTIMSPFEPIVIKAPVCRAVEKVADGRVDNKFLTKNVKNVSNHVLKMRYGIGKLLKHFSKAKPVKLT